VVWRPNCWRKTSLGVGAVYECPKKVRDLFFFQASSESNESEINFTASMVSRVADAADAPEEASESTRTIHTTATHTTAAHDEGSFEGTDSESDIDTPHDTFGIAFDDKPTLGGVAGDPTKSIGGVSEITAPTYYIPNPSISVPQEMTLSVETTIKANIVLHRPIS